MHDKPAAQMAEKTLLIIDDDAPYRQRLAQALEKRGFAVTEAESVETGIASAKARPPRYAVVDLRLADGSGLDVVPEIKKSRSDCRVVILTAMAISPPPSLPLNPVLSITCLSLPMPIRWKQPSSNIAMLCHHRQNSR